MRLTILFAFITLITRAQTAIDIVPTKLTKPTVSYLYIGVENPVTVAGSGKYTLASSAGNRITNNGSGNDFIIKANNVGTDTLKVILNKKVVYTEVFKVAKIPDPVARVGGIKADRASVSLILLQPMLTFTLPDCYFKFPANITSFTFISGTTSISNSGPSFSQDIIDAVKVLKPGNKITFDRIIVKSPDDVPRVLQPITITVVK